MFQRYCVCSEPAAVQRRREQRLLWPICRANNSLCASYDGAMASFLLSNSWGVFELLQVPTFHLQPWRSAALGDMTQMSVAAHWAVRGPSRRLHQQHNPMHGPFQVS